jgi:branched-chain amino acid transport system substrate-binding protein
MKFARQATWRGRPLAQRIRMVAVIAVLPAAGLATAACGASSGGASSGGGSGSTIIIGAPNPLTGSYAENGQNDVNGAELAAQMINAAGGIKNMGGAKIKIVTADTSSDNPAQSESVTEKLVSSNHAVALIGSYASAMTLTSARAAEKERVPMLTESTVDELTESGNPYIFQLPPLISASGIETLQDYAQIFHTAGTPLKSIASLAIESTIASTTEKSFESTAKSLGMTVPLYTTFPEGLTSATPLVTSIRAANPDAIQIGAPLPDTSVLVKAIRGAGIQTPIIDAIDQSGFAQSVGSAANGVLVETFWSDSMKLPGGLPKLLAAERAAYLKAYHVSSEPAEAGESFTAVYEIAAAISAAHSTSPQKIASELHSMTFTPTDGYAAMMPPAGVVQFNSSGLNSDARPVILQWQNGETPIIAPADIASAKPIGIK